MPVNIQWLGRSPRAGSAFIFEAEHRRATQDALAEVAILFQRRMKGVVSKPGLGRVYKRGSRSHRASAPGDPPTVDTGNYRRSIQVDLSGLENSTPVARVGTDVIYGRYLEFGTRHMEARPHWRPELARAADAMQQLYQAVYQQSIQRQSV